MKQWILISKFVFKEFVQFNAFFTLICAYTLYTYGERSHGYIILIKLSGYFVTFLQYYFSKSNRLYFFYNVGWGLKRLTSVSFIMDLLLLAVILILVNKI